MRGRFFMGAVVLAAASAVACVPEVPPDTTPPDTAINTGPPGHASANVSTFTFVSDEGGSTFVCSVDSGTFTACASPFTTPVPLTDGPHGFAVKAIDEAGNVDPTPATYAWTIDATPPTIVILHAPPSPGPSTSSIAIFIFTSEVGVNFECRVDGATFVACNGGFVSEPLSSGFHTFDVKATDAVGNVGTAEHRWQIAL